MNEDKHGKKFDTGKPRVGLIVKDFPHAIEAIAKVGTYGANKYTESGWKHVDNAEKRYYDALHRHILEHAKGVDKDEESGLLHLAHAAWNILALIEMSTGLNYTCTKFDCNNLNIKSTAKVLNSTTSLNDRLHKIDEKLSTHIKVMNGGYGYCKCGNHFSCCPQCG